MPDSNLPIYRPRRALDNLAEIVLPKYTSINDKLELVIQIDDSDVNIAEFSSFLGFIDRTYGRLNSDGLRSYAQSRNSQAQASFRSGSWELILEELVTNSDRLVVLWIVLKYAPSGLENLTSTYRNIEEATFTRLRRKQLREQMKADDKLSKLDQKRLNELIRFLDHLYQREQRFIPRIKRFILRYLKNISIRIKNKN